MTWSWVRCLELLKAREVKYCRRMVSITEYRYYFPSFHKTRWCEKRFSSLQLKRRSTLSFGVRGQFENPTNNYVVVPQRHISATSIAQCKLHWRKIDTMKQLVTSDISANGLLHKLYFLHTNYLVKKLHECIPNYMTPCCLCWHPSRKHKEIQNSETTSLTYKTPKTCTELMSNSYVL